MRTVTRKSADCANCARPSQRQLSHGHMFNHDGIHLKRLGLRTGETAACDTSMSCEAGDQSASQAQNDNTFIGTGGHRYTTSGVDSGFQELTFGLGEG
jgi:hypothetical protein